jgi:hypothetical protein
LSVVRLLLVAAALGVVGGVVLSQAHQAEGEMLEGNTDIIDRALPVIGAVPARGRDLTEPDPLSLRGIPAYPGAEPRKIVGSRPGAKVNAISWFATDDSTDRVLSFYEDYYTQANVLHVTQRWGQKSGYVSWFEHHQPGDGGLPEFGAGVLHMVSAFRDGDTTTVLVSATDPMAIAQALSPLPAGVSLPAGARPQVLNLGEAGQERFSVFASYQSMGREALEADLQKRMTAAGWAISERAVAPDGRVTLVGKLSARVQIAAIEGTATSSQVLITVEEK